LGSDGFWDYFGVDELGTLLDQCHTQSQDSLRNLELGKFLRNEFLDRVCKSNNLEKNQLFNMPLGKNNKRKIHDDITVLVIDLQKYNNL